MKKSIVAIVSFEIAVGIVQKLEENVIVVVSQCDHERAPSEIVEWTPNAFVQNQINKGDPTTAGSQMQNREFLFGLLMGVHQWIIKKQAHTFLVLIQNCVMQSS